MTDRLPAHLEASALLRRADAKGGFATIVRKGDADRGALLLLVTDRGTHVACLERTLGTTGRYGWQRVGPVADADAQAIAEFTEKRVRFDEDLWLIELDIPQPERFIAETTTIG
ncbi:MAG: DUF1491 family protein [Sphingomicrobium sp.]